MPLSDGAWGAIGSIGGAAAGAAANSAANNKKRKFSEYMYDKETRDARARWEAENAYNSPKSQMARFKEAGLNPNLIYGSGGGSSGNAGSIDSTSQTMPNFEPIIGTGEGANAINSFTDLAMKKAGIDKLEEDTRKTHTETNIITQKWLVDKLLYAKNQGNQSDVLNYQAQLKEMEQKERLGEHLYHTDQYTKKTGGSNDMAPLQNKGYRTAENKDKQIKAAIQKIKAETKNIQYQNFRIKELNELINSLPIDADVGAAIKIFFTK